MTFYSWADTAFQNPRGFVHERGVVLYLLNVLLTNVKALFYRISFWIVELSNGPKNPLWLFSCILVMAPEKCRRCLSPSNWDSGRALARN